MVEKLAVNWRMPVHFALAELVDGIAERCSLLLLTRPPKSPQNGSKVISDLTVPQTIAELRYP